MSTTANYSNLKTKPIVPTIIYWIFFINCMCDLFSYMPIEFVYAIRMTTGGFSILYYVLKREMRYTWSVIVFMFIYTAFGIVSNMYNNNADLRELLWPIAFMGLGTLFLNYRFRVQQIKISLLLFYALLVLHYLRMGSIDSSAFDSVNSMNTILEPMKQTL